MDNSRNSSQHHSPQPAPKKKSKQQYKCGQPKCQKIYTSYTAFYNHCKKAHQGQFPSGSLLNSQIFDGPTKNRGRPRIKKNQVKNQFQIQSMKAQNELIQFMGTIKPNCNRQNQQLISYVQDPADRIQQAIIIVKQQLANHSLGKPNIPQNINQYLEDIISINNIIINNDLPQFYDPIDHQQYADHVDSYNFTSVIALALNAQSRNLQQTNTITNLIDKNCLKYDANTGDCIQCSYRSIFKNKKCQQISPYCQTWNSQTGQCLTCYIGYKLDKETCIIEIQNTNQNQSGGQNQNNGQNQNQNSSQNTQIPLNQRDAYNTIEGCLKLTADGLACQTCQPRRVKISGNNCLKVSDLCKQWSQSNGDCTQCYPSYKISQGKCIYDNSMDNINGQNQTGGNQNGGQNQTGGNQNGGQNQTGGNQNGGQNQTGGNQNSGQNQTGGQGSEIDANSIVQGCIQLQADKINCAKCQFRRIKISGTNCQKVSDDCNTWNQVNGACQSCYQGYKVQNGQCVLDAQYQNGGQNQTGGNQNGGQNQTGGNQNGGQNQTGGNQNSGQNQTGGQGSEIDANSIVQGCIQLQADKINCAKCQFRRIKISGTNCQKVSDDCNTWNQVNGACQSCYQGYKVQNGQCVVQVTQVV